ncbi:Transient receptor ion channel domain,Ankyrin repeat-containing domain,Ankyrin repeat [Cinara cedri]|uniref:Transient receptor ion channel domain,Ankyrin repeat-containing domain,Ankyrin repeat n=1 Tax=Cinara cedri TaxID=506608 RepID=A0A5E4N215_9HEMI|nr:Transient receptor ion channel domain,Ankyrin repeat-containing domain,Ankyrin repeat [Cinara cedri]
MSDSYNDMNNEYLDDSDQSEYATSDWSTANDSIEIQRKFMHFIKMCDISSIKNLIESNYDLDLNCKNYQGMTGLNLAVQVDCEQMVDFLLSQPGLETGDALMYAIRENNYSIVVKLLDVLQAKNQEKAQLGYDNSVEFPSHLTPLMLAAQCGHYKIIELLLKRGHTIPTPHEPQCFCKEVCKSSTRLNNGLGATELKLSVFRALTDPTYISLTSKDPILTAFQLSNRLRKHGNVDHVFKSDYKSLDFQTRMFAVRMIGLCRSSTEVELVLTQQEGCNIFGSFPYHRLVMAVDLKQKEFVAHAYVQQTLETVWAGDWYAWRRYGLKLKCCLVFLRIFVLPLIVFLYIFMPYSKWTQHYMLPVNQMLNYLASYSVFLTVLTYENNFNKIKFTGDSLCWISKLILVLYVVSFTIRAVNHILVQGPKLYFSMPWNVYNCVQLIILITTLIYWWLLYTSTFARTTDHDSNNYVGKPIERKYWRSLDPVLVAEGLLAVATVMSYLQLMFLYQLNYTLGPMYVCLRKMITYFERFAVLHGVIILAFTAGLCRFYQYYGGMTRIDPVTRFEVKQDDAFVNTYSTLKVLFWGIFRMTSSTAGSVVIETVENDDDDDDCSNKELANNHYFTQAVGTLLYTMFEIVALVIMVNMLRGTMTNAFNRFSGNTYIEWVFGRTQVFLSFSVNTELPPPLNLIPSVFCIVATFLCLVKRLKAALIGIAHMISSKRFQMTPYTSKDFTFLMRKLVQRYFRDELSATHVRRRDPV